MVLELVDYPAVAPEATQRQIDTFRAACIRIRDTAEHHRKRALITVATKHADTLRARRDELETLLAEGDRWLIEHPDKADEDQWIAVDQEYRAIWNALREGMTIAFGTHATPEQARMWEEAS